MRTIYNRKFKYFNKKMNLFEHPYNCGTADARMTERCLEMAISKDWITSHLWEDFIEIGAVTPYYLPNVRHIVCDPFDEHPDVNLRCSMFDLDLVGKNVLSISTIEHIATGDYNLAINESESAIKGLEKIITESKECLVSFPTGYNLQLDNDFLNLYKKIKLKSNEKLFVVLYERNITDNRFKVVNLKKISNIKYGPNTANGVLVIEKRQVKDKKKIIRNIFSVTNEYNHKVVRLFGIKMKFKRKPKASPSTLLPEPVCTDEVVVEPLVTLDSILDYYKKSDEPIIACTRNNIKYVLSSQCEHVAKPVLFGNNVNYIEVNNFFKIAQYFHGEQKGIFLDVGANVGTSSMPAALSENVSKVFAFEPHPFNFSLLSANISLNSLNDKIVPVNTAIGNEKCEIEFSVSPDNSGDHRCVVSNEKQDKCCYGEDSRVNIKVPVTSLNDYFDQNPQREKVQWLWVDTQGFEYFVLSGSDRVIRDNTSLVIEFWPYQMERNHSLELCLDYLKKNFSRFVVMQEVDFTNLSESSITVYEINDLDIYVDKFLNQGEGIGFNDLFLLK